MLNQNVTTQETDITKMSKEEIQLFLANLPETVDSSSTILTNQEGFLDEQILSSVRSYINLSVPTELEEIEKFLELAVDKIMCSIDADDIEVRKSVVYSKDVLKRLLEIVAF